uniref:Uncharacterized protein n=1 Tax=Octopus bimaculoides TaxID=37653 RepID=A0A0L8FZ38_OCTBM
MSQCHTTETLVNFDSEITTFYSREFLKNFPKICSSCVDMLVQHRTGHVK